MLKFESFGLELPWRCHSPSIICR